MTIEMYLKFFAILTILILAVVGLAHILHYLSGFRLKRVDDEPTTKKIDVPPQT